jgi:hypothetical protein
LRPRDSKQLFTILSGYMAPRPEALAIEVGPTGTIASRFPVLLADKPKTRLAGPWSELVLERADRLRYLSFALLAVALILGFNGQWRIQPDSGLYLALGKNLALGRGYMYRGEPQQLAYPGLPVALSVLYRGFPNHYIVAADAFIFLSAVAALLLTYRLVYMVMDRPTAVLITFGLGFTHLFFRYAFEILTDMPFLAAVMAVLAAHEGIFSARTPRHPRRLFWQWVLLIAGLLAGISLRPTMLAFLAADVAAILWIAIQRGKWLAACAGVAIAVLAFALFVWFDPRPSSGGLFSGVYEQSALAAFREAFQGHLGIFTRNFQDLLGFTAARSLMGMPLGWTWLNVIFGTTILASGVALVKTRPLWGLWIVSTILMLLFVISLDRYVLQVLPLLILGWWRTQRFLCIRLPHPWGNTVFSILLVVGATMNTIQVCNMILRQHDHPFYSLYRDGKFSGLVEIAAKVPSYSRPDDVVIVPTEFSRPFTFLADRRTYEPLDRVIPSGPGNLLVVLDPTDSNFLSWLNRLGIVLESPPLVVEARAKGKPALELVRGYRSVAP